MMINISKFTIVRWLAFLTMMFGVSSVQAETKYKSIDWLDLLTDEEQVQKAAEPEVDHSKVPAGGVGIDSQTGSDTVRIELNGQKISIPGFIVPMEMNDEGHITEFFLVPYYGACIHVPPPPPNQIMYVKYPQGLDTDIIYSPFRIKGTIKTEKVKNMVAYSAYSMDADLIEPYD